MPSTKPHIPKDVLERLLALPIMKGVRSTALSDSFDSTRLKIMNHEMDIDGLQVVREGAQLTVLQYAAHTGDIPLAYEMMRLGAIPDTKDSCGRTALQIAYAEYSKYQQLFRIFSNTVQSASDGLPECLRCREIARLLVEQHATLDVVADGDPLKETILHAACMVRDWEFIQLLVHHGAVEKPNVNGKLPSHHLTPQEKRRLDDIISSAPTERPPRICPCWSGETLSECHEKERKPYPAEFLCKCRSGRSYKRCCKARNICILELWNAADEWIQPTYQVNLPGCVPVEVHEVVSSSKSETFFVQRNSVDFYTRVDRFFDDYVIHQIDILVQRNMIDPAFAWAVKGGKRIPRPLGPMWPKTFMEMQAETFNNYVDEYIRNGNDMRPKLDIERAAKIRPSGGALFKVCKAEQCNTQEGGDNALFKCCGKCKLAFYCGLDCQRAHWRNHKMVCGSANQTEQTLPSQQAVEMHILNPLLESTDKNVKQYCNAMKVGLNSQIAAAFSDH